MNPVLFISGVRGDTRRYRTFHPFEQLRLAGVPCQLGHMTDRDLPQKVMEARLVVFHRVTWDPYVQALVDELHGRGGLALLDTDDLTFDPAAFRWIASPDFADPVRAALYQEDMRRNRRTAELCDGALTSTRFLSGEVMRMGKPAWVHRNAFSLEMLASSEQAYREHAPHPGRVVLGYASGTPTHDRDFAVAKPSVQAVLKRHPEAELWLVGPLDPGEGWGALDGRIRRFPLAPWRALPGLLAQFDINLAPLVTDNPFAQSKSEIKWMEAALVRVPTVASPTEAFRDAIQDGVTGCLAEGSEGWQNALESLLADGSRRQALGEQAYQVVLKAYHPAARAAELVRTLNGATQALRGKPWWEATAQIEGNAAGGELEPEAEAHPTLGEMALYTLRHRGLGTLLRQEWIYFRRAIAPLVPYRAAHPAGEAERRGEP